MDLFTIGTVLGAGIAILTLSTITYIERRQRDAKSFRSLVEQRVRGKGDPGRGNDLHANTVIMRPATALRIAILALGAFGMWYVWGPYVQSSFFDLNIAMIVTTIIFYIIVFISNYEARYDSEGVTAPNWFFRDKRYEWPHLVNFNEDGNLLYKLPFMDHGSLRLQKYLVGMPAYLTFLSDIEATKREA
jgi:hypothetical protein